MNEEHYVLTYQVTRFLDAACLAQYQAANSGRLANSSLEVYVYIMSLGAWDREMNITNSCKK